MKSHIVQEMERVTGHKAKRIAVKMRGIRDLSNFIKTMNQAKKQATKSTTLYG